MDQDVHTTLATQVPVHSRTEINLSQGAEGWRHKILFSKEERQGMQIERTQDRR